MKLVTDCPQCGEPSPEEEYKGSNGNEYPICSDFNEYSTDMGYGTDWKETHWCDDCKIEWSFGNGT